MTNEEIIELACACKPVVCANGQPVLGDFVIEFAHAIRDRALEEADVNAPWLTLAHTICTEIGIEQGAIMDRLTQLRGIVLEGTIDTDGLVDDIERAIDAAQWGGRNDNAIP